ncbi:MAG TPA: nucleoside phosphorylase [Puia sp.]|nr:nucleoside phosphorylase [Puia sp.]
MHILENKFYEEESVFKAENLLREAKRQKRLANCLVPSICVLDPDGDMLSYLLKAGRAKLNSCWACYHTKLYTFQLEGTEFGIVACAVGASFAVLIAEQLFVSGCDILISITSSGIINRTSEDIEYVIIEEALRDEGTSYHYLPGEEAALMNASLLLHLRNDLLPSVPGVKVGKSWTTDAPYRETYSAIKKMEEAGVDIVEMEAAALYAFAKAKNKKVICFAHITNSMAQTEFDFEKGAENGSVASLHLIHLTAKSICSFIQ